MGTWRTPSAAPWPLPACRSSEPMHCGHERCRLSGKSPIREPSTGWQRTPSESASSSLRSVLPSSLPIEVVEHLKLGVHDGIEIGASFGHPSGDPRTHLNKHRSVRRADSDSHSGRHERRTAKLHQFPEVGTGPLDSPNLAWLAAIRLNGHLLASLSLPGLRPIGFELCRRVDGAGLGVLRLHDLVPPEGEADGTGLRLHGAVPD